MVTVPVITGLAAPLAGGLTYIGLNQNVKAKRDISNKDGFQVVARRSLPGYPGVSDEAVNQYHAANVNRKVTVTQTSENCTC